MGGSGYREIILVGSCLAGISQILKIYILTKNPSDMPPPMKLLAYAISGAIGYFSWIMLVGAFWPDVETPELMLGSAGVIGWLGGDINIAMGRFLQQRFGIPLGIPPIEEDDRDGDGP